LKYLIPTIDVEAIRSLSRLGNFDQLIMGKINNEYFGATRIAEIINEYGGSGTFFVDFAEHEHGINKLKFLSEKIVANNCDVQLHIHPQFIADKSRYLLNSYNKNEQYEIISKTIKIYEDCINEKPISFRAGGYGADENTIEVLSDLGINIDSSYFFNHKWCKLKEKPINVVSKNSNFYEIPVTIFSNNISYKFLNIKLKKKSLIKKLDVDGCSEEELIKGFDSLKNSNVRIIILFLHSYSLINWSSDYKKISPDYKDIDKFRIILQHAINSGYKIESIKNIRNKLDEFINDSSNIPQITTVRNPIQSAIITAKHTLRKTARGK